MMPSKRPMMSRHWIASDSIYCRFSCSEKRKKPWTMVASDCRRASIWADSRLITATVRSARLPWPQALRPCKCRVSLLRRLQQRHRPLSLIHPWHHQSRPLMPQVHPVTPCQHLRCPAIVVVKHRIPRLLQDQWTLRRRREAVPEVERVTQHGATRRPTFTTPRASAC